MELQKFYESGLEFDLERVSQDRDLTIHIQKVLMWVGLLEATAKGADGKLGPLTTEAFQLFQTITKCPKVGTLDKATAKALIETSPEKIRSLIPKVKLRPGSDLAGRVIKYMVSKDYNISQEKGTYNIVYIEGVDPDGTENSDELNTFNDLRMVIQIDAMGVPKVVGKWVATTEPGTFWTENRMDEKKRGAARIKFGQYKAWRVRAHITKSSNQFPALRQDGEVSVFRDGNEDGFRTGDFLDTGLFGINQHHAADSPRTDIGLYGAGCLVGQMEDEHNEFMDIIMQDKRYKLNNDYLFETAIIAGDELNKMFPI
jgi:hypothetical protein